MLRTAGSKNSAICGLARQDILLERVIHSWKAIVYPLILILPDRISNCGSFSLRPKRMKYGFEDPLKLGFVVLSKYLVMTSMSSGFPYVDPQSFSITCDSIDK